MAPLFLLTAAFGIVVLVLLFVVARFVDRRVRLMASDETVTDLQAQLEQSLEQQARLLQRVQNLEAIVTAEAWDVLQEKQAAASTPSLAVPDDPSDEEKAARLAKRQRS